MENFPLIKLTVSIENKWGAPIPLNIKNLKLYENKKEVSPIIVNTIDSVKTPIYTVIIMDKSGSMKGDAIELAKKGAIAFVKMMKGGDNVAYIEFDTRVSLITDFLKEKTKIESYIGNTVIGSDTAFLDALYMGIELLKKAPQNSVKVILALTDGRENKSSRKLPEILYLSNSIGVPIYTIGLGNEIDRGMLKEIAKKTHGNFYNTPKAIQLIEIYKKISLLLHSRLIVKFKTIFTMDSKWHLLRITIPYMGGLIEGKKSYLSAKRSTISTELLGKVRTEMQKRALGEKEIQRIKAREEIKKKKDQIIYILFIILIIMLIVLIIVLIRKRG